MELGKARSTEEIIKDIKATLESKVKDNVATHGGEINFPYDIQLTIMFIFITLYLVMEIIF